ncbi:hypothetical protein NDU88_009935 [Pleurodeles waltl]|uniref:Uncharacterized protein n=1 Tax=Pleurodeles waltl TaxID=8319 RepID=A0AAV7QX64_PLEWA|nr:hypothetical protein NDU88_009935 [Pleurodeles waltl]
MGVKRALREERLRYSLLFPSKLKVILDDTTCFFQEPDEAWIWLESYSAGALGTKHMDCKPHQRRGKRRYPRESTGSQRVSKPTCQQAHQGKRVALQVAASLTEAKSLDEG